MYKGIKIILAISVFVYRNILKIGCTSFISLPQNVTDENQYEQVFYGRSLFPVKFYYNSVDNLIKNYF